MIELVMSRIWMVLAGVMLTGAVLSAFGALDEDTREAGDLEGASSLVGTIEAMAAGSLEGRMTIEVDDVLPSPGASLTVYDGSIWTGEGPGARAVSMTTPVVLIDGGSRVDGLVLHAGDALLITSSGVNEERTVQLEKVSATNRTVSTNLLHSASVL